MSLKKERWVDLCERMGCERMHVRFGAVASAYSEDHRTYHTGRHIAECLHLLDALGEVCEWPDEVEFAIWMHDVVYRPRRSDNELESAELASSWLAEDRVSAQTTHRIHSLILATRHNDEPRTRDAEVLVDIDLHILGASPARFDEYEDQIRQEYDWVPSVIFRRRRARLLRAFLARKRTYYTRECRDRFEKRARSNLRRSMERLAPRVSR